MKYIFILLLFVVFASFGQEQVRDLEVDDIRKNEKSKSEKDESFMQRKLNLAFSNVATNNEFSNVGNYASISTDDESLAASLFIMLDTLKVLNLSVEAGATQGVAAIFKEGDLNAKVKLSVGLHLLNRKSNNVIALSDTELTRLEVEEDQLQEAFDNYVLRSNAKKEYFNAKAALKKIITSIKEAELALEKEKDEELKDDIRHSIVVLNVEKQIASSNLNRISDIDKNEEYIMKYNTLQGKLEGLEKKKMAIKSERVILKWWSLGYAAQNDSFILYDSTQVLSKQLVSSNYTSHSAFVSFNLLRNAKYDDDHEFKSANKLLLSIGGELSFTSNLSALKQIEVVDTQVQNVDPLRETLIKQSAFENKFEGDLLTLTPYVNFLYFLDNNDKVALSINPKIVYSQKEKPITSTKFGVLIPFIKKDDIESKVNIEFFYQLNDVFNKMESKNSLLNRNIIGVQGIFPFNF